MRIVFVAAILIAVLSLTPQIALAAMCGSSSDIAALEKAAIAYANHPLPTHVKMRKIDKTWIVSIAVLQHYAEVNVDYPNGPGFQYWTKNAGVWTFASALPPKNWPPAITAQLDSLSGLTGTGGKRCLNPSWINRSSSG